MVHKRTRYRLYVDESGDKTYDQMEESQKRFLCLCGVIIPWGDPYRIIEGDMENLKQKYFAAWYDQPVIFTRSKMARREDAFSVLGNDDELASKFDSELLEFMANHHYLVISVVINKMDHKERYSEAWNPYSYCLWAMMERYCGFLRYEGGEGDIVAESRGKEDDYEIKDAYVEAYNSGTNVKTDPAFFQDNLTSNEIKIKKKSQNIAGLQIADMLAHPSKQDILLHCNRIDEDLRNAYPKAICDLLVKRKYLRRNDSGQIWSYGQYMINC